MKSLITLVTLILVTTALFTQNNMPTGINNVFNLNEPDHQKEFITKHNKILGEFIRDTLFVKNINGIIWVKDSTLFYDYSEDGIDWNLAWREKTLTRDDFGHMTTAISHVWDGFNGTWSQYLDTISASYYNTDFIYEYLEKGWNSQANEWNDTSEYRLNNEDGNAHYCIRRSWDIASNTFQGSGYKFTQTFDENRKLIKQLGYYWDADTQEWVDPWLDDLFIFDENGNIIQMTKYSWDSNNEEWMNSILSSYAYNDSGNIILWKQQIWDSNTQEWINSRQYFFTNNSNGNRTHQHKQAWDVETQEWVSINQYFNIYDENSNITHQLFQTWDNDTEEWVNYSQYIMTYDDNGNQMTFLEQFWDFDSGEWLNSLWYLYTYDNYDKLVQVHAHSWDNDTEQWVNYWLQLYTYDDNGNQTQKLGLNWNIDLEDWRNDWSYLFAFDENNNKIQESLQAWDTETEKWDYHWRYDYYWSQYEITLVNDENNLKIDVYPNPSNGLITIISTHKSSYNIEILNISGQMVHSVSITSLHQQIDLRNLSRGVYFIKVIGDNYIKTERLIIK